MLAMRPGKSRILTQIQTHQIEICVPADIFDKNIALIIRYLYHLIIRLSFWLYSSLFRFIFVPVKKQSYDQNRSSKVP